VEIIGYILALLVGITLGLVGSGGSILTVPILVYLMHIKPQLATTYSLFIVGISALVGAFRHYKLKNLQLNIGLWFGIPSVFTLLITRKLLLPLLPENLFYIFGFLITKNAFIMMLFALLMLAASSSMIGNKNKTTAISTNKIQLIIMGLLIGIVTGFLGAGGGFLIIPTLLIFGGLQMKQAVGTSLLIIACNSLIGFSGDVINHVHIDFKLLLLLASLAIIGIIIGTQISKKMDGNKLKPIFGWFILGMGIYILMNEFFLK
jgi:uncharacterized membrane protein YfcA